MTDHEIKVLHLALPEERKPLRPAIMRTLKEDMIPMQTGDYGSSLIFVEQRKVPGVDDCIMALDDVIMPSDELLVHLRDIPEGPVTVLDDIRMTVVLIGGKEILHKSGSFISPHGAAYLPSSIRGSTIAELGSCLLGIGAGITSIKARWDSSMWIWFIGIAATLPPISIPTNIP